MSEKLRAGEVIGIILFEEDDRIAVENEARLAIVGWGLAAEIVNSFLEAAGIEGTDRPITHDEEAGFTGQHQVGSCVPGASGDTRIHPVDHLAVLLEGSDHFRAVHRVGVAFDESLAEKVDIHPENDDLEG